MYCYVVTNKAWWWEKFWKIDKCAAQLFGSIEYVIHILHTYIHCNAKLCAKGQFWLKNVVILNWWIVIFFKLVKSGLSFTKLSGIGLYENTVVTGCPIKFVISEVKNILKEKRQAHDKGRKQIIMQALEYFQVTKYICYLLVKIVSDSYKNKKSPD